MPYKSLYDFIELKKVFQLYNGTLDLVLSSIIKILEKKDKISKDYSTLAFQAPRIIRALVDYKNDHADDKKFLVLLRAGIKVALKIYRDYNDPKTKDAIVRFQAKIVQSGHKEVLHENVRQYVDQMNLIVPEAALSKKSAIKLNTLIGSKKAIMIAIGHGAINSGMDVFLRYQDAHPKRNVMFYTVRFSSTPYKKYKDTVPQVTRGEIKWLQKQAVGRKIVLYDENKHTGTTLKKVVAYLSKEVFPHHRIDVLYNLKT